MGKAELHDNMLAIVAKPPFPYNAKRWGDIRLLVSRPKNDEFHRARVGLLTYHIISKPCDVLTVIGQLNIRKSLLRQDVITDSEAALFLRNYHTSPFAVVDTQGIVGCDIE